MTASYVYAGARQGKDIRGGLFRKPADGDRWEALEKGLRPGAGVHAIAVHPADPALVYAATVDGPFRSEDHGTHWHKLPFPHVDLQGWSVFLDPEHPPRVYYGTAPARIYRSDDAGMSWRQLQNAVLPAYVKMPFPCRVVRIAAHPLRPDELYAGLEVGGVMRSDDAGETWTDCTAGLIRLAERPHLKNSRESGSDIEGMTDAHALCVSRAAPDLVFLAARTGLFRSSDRGATWEDMEIRRFCPVTYSHNILVSPHDARTLYTCMSDEAFGKEGHAYRSDDLGASWSRMDTGIEAHSTMMCMAMSPRDAGSLHCGMLDGQMMGTTDGGRTWRESHLPEGVKQVQGMACA